MTHDSPRLTEQTARLFALRTDPWLSCEDCFDRMDTFAEALLTRPGADDLAMRVHVAGCPACAEELESLVELVARENGLDAAPALRRLHEPVG
jgi:hypothetical protein